MEALQPSRTRPKRSRWRRPIVGWLVAAVALGAVPAGQTRPLPSAEEVARTTLTVSGSDQREVVSDRVDRLEFPMTFERNEGQTDRRVRFLGRGPGYTVFFTQSEAVLSFPAPGQGSASAVERRVLRLKPVGTAAGVRVGGLGVRSGTANYLLGDDRSRWRSGVSTYGAVRYSEVYPGIDLLYHARRGNFEYDFVVMPGADPGPIGMAFKGADLLSIDPAGDLLVRSGGVKLRFGRPHVYQRGEHGREAVRSRYVLDGRRRVRFQLGRYDTGKRLVIDPALVYSTYFGGAEGVDNISGNAPDRATAIAVGSDGSTYITGETWSVSFPTKNAYQENLNCAAVVAQRLCTDAFITKMSPDGSELVYSTYLGGGRGGTSNDRTQDYGYAIRVDASGHAYVTGETKSSDFPTTPGSLRPARTCSGTHCEQDAFVTKLRPDGAGLVYSTYLGGSGDDRGLDLDVDPSGAYVFGRTCSTDFPTAPAQPLQGDQGGCDAFVTKLQPDGSSLVYSTYLGGSGHDGGGDDPRGGIVVDASGNAFVASTTQSSVETVFPGKVHGLKNGFSDAFVAKIATDGAGLLYWRYLGGAGRESGIDIDIDSAGNAYVIGQTVSTDFPTNNAFDAGCGSDGQCGAGDPRADAFVAKVGSDGSQLSYSTYLGGSLTEGVTRDGSQELVGAIDAADSGTVWVTGSTYSEDFPQRDPLAPRGLGLDAFVAQLDTTSSGPGSLLFSSYLGGTRSDSGEGIALSSGDVYVAGGTESFDLPTLRPFQSENLQHPSRGRTGFVARIAPVDPEAPLVTDISPDYGPLPGGTSVKIAGANLDDATAVTFGDVNASFEPGPDGTIIATAPPHMAGSPAITVTNPAGTSPPNPVARFAYGEGSFQETGDVGSIVSASTATLLPGGDVLLVGSSASPTGRSKLYDPRSGTWSSTPGILVQPRGRHTATLLGNGKVLIVGGASSPQSAELYEPGSGQWAAAAPPLARHANHATALVQDGRVLVVGDSGERGNLVELYTPEPSGPGSWALAQPFEDTRKSLTATLLGSGKVLVAGGNPPIDGGTTDRAALFDASGPAGRWAEAGDMKQPRAIHTATLLPGGKVLVIGGKDGTLTSDTAEIYDVGTNEWSLIARMDSRRHAHASTLLPNGKVLVSGGSLFGGDEPLRTAELFDPFLNEGRGRFVPAGLMSGRRSAVVATLLSSDPEVFEADPDVCGDDCGKVLIVGGRPDSSAELYTPAPSIKELSSTSGSAAGGRSVAITGTGFTHGLREIRFDDVSVPCPSAACVIDSYSKLTVTTPAHDPGVVDVVVTNEGGYSSVTDATRFTYVAAPGEVADLSAQALSGSEIKLSFSAPAALGSTEAPQAPAQRFVIKQSATPISSDQDFAAATSLCGGVCSFTPPIEMVGDAVSLTIEDLAPATTYHYALKVIDASGTTGPLSNQASAMTSAITPGSVSDLTAEPLSETKVKLIFSAAGSDGAKPPPINDYVIVQSADPISDERSFDAARRLCPDACSFTPQAVGDTLTLEVTDLTPGTTYHYALRARDPHGNLGPRSNTASVKTKGTAPGGGQATPVERTTRLRLKGHLVATGRVTAEGPNACVSKVRVLIHRNHKLIKTITSKDDGRFLVRLTDRTGRYRATAEKVTIGDSLCLRDAATRRHRH